VAQPKPPEEKQRTDLQGCDPPPHMHVGENNKTQMRHRVTPTPPLVAQQREKASQNSAAMNPLAAEWAPKRPYREPEPLVASALSSDGNWYQVDADNPVEHGKTVTYLPQLMKTKPHCSKCGEYGHWYSECPTDAQIRREKDEQKACGTSKPAPWILALENLRNKPPTNTTHHETSPPSEENYDTPSPTPSELQREEEYYNQNDDWDDS